MSLQKYLLQLMIKGMYWLIMKGFSSFIYPKLIEYYNIPQVLEKSIILPLSPTIYSFTK
ncbi:hypothetical protein CRYUN_Cryun38cG0002300 [Craigia yunnanensis]